MINKQWHAAIAVIEQLEQAGFEAVFVGGAVRDLLLNRPIHDIDIATSALPMEVKNVFSKTVDIGIEHGTVLVLDAGEPIEVTTFRTDGEYTDHRRPDQVQFVRSLEEDLLRRDFTMNAMALRKDHSLVDYYDGQKDLANKVIRAVGNPVARFEEDALRMLRAVRFVSQLGFMIEDKTLQAMKQQAAQIQFVAKERIAMELEKLWIGAYVYNSVQLIATSELAHYLPGNIADHTKRFKGFQTNNPDVGWAYLVHVHDDLTLIGQYRLSNKTKVFVKQIQSACASLQVGWTARDYFDYSLDVLQTAYIFMGKQQEIPFSIEEIADKKAALPIQTKQDLAVTGHDFIEWRGGRGGPWLSVVLEAVLDAVLQKIIDNDRQQIKDWFLHDFNQA